MNWNNPTKNEMRTGVFRLFPKNVPAFLDIPAEEILSVREALKQNVIGTRTKTLVLVEKNRIKSSHIAARVNGLNLGHTRTHVHHGELHKLRLQAALGGCKLPAANFDTCSTPTPDNLRFFAREITAPDLLAPGAVIAFTFAVAPRGSAQWFNTVHDLYGDETNENTIKMLILHAFWRYELAEVDSQVYGITRMLSVVYRNTGHANRYDQTKKYADLCNAFAEYDKRP